MDFNLEHRKDVFKKSIDEAVGYYLGKVDELILLIQSKNKDVELAESNFEIYLSTQMAEKENQYFSIIKDIENDFKALKKWKEKNPVICKSWREIEDYLRKMSYEILSDSSVAEDLDELRTHTNLRSMRDIIRWEYDDYWEHYNSIMKNVAEVLSGRVKM